MNPPSIRAFPRHAEQQFFGVRRAIGRLRANRLQWVVADRGGMNGVVDLQSVLLSRVDPPKKWVL